MPHTARRKKKHSLSSTNTTTFTLSYLRNYASDQNLQTSLIGRIAKSKYCKIVRYKRIQLHSKMNFNNTKWISPTQLIEGSEGVNKLQRPSRLGLVEDGMSQAKRSVAPVHVQHGDKAFDVRISRIARGTWNLVRLGSTSEGEGRINYLGKITIPTLTKSK